MERDGERGMSTRLSLICHAGLPPARAVGFAQDDSADPGQLERVPGMLAGLGRIERLWTAPERRAQQTAEMLGTAATVVAALRDCDFGRWQARALADIQASEPEAAAAWLSDMGSAPHGGESLLAVLERVGTWLDGHREPGHTVAVTHPAVIRAAVVRCLGAPSHAFWRVDVEPLSVTDLRLYQGRWTLRSVGRTSPSV
jgi:broad specificity phosphatase PhoE